MPRLPTFVSVALLLAALTAPLAAQSTPAPIPRRLGSLDALVDLPAGWTIRANPTGFHLDDETGRERVVIHPDPLLDGLFTRLPRGRRVTERTLPSGARYYRRRDRDGIAIFVALTVDEERALVCACEGPYEAVCTSLRRASE
jgi:hypothetical protein